MTALSHLEVVRAAEDALRAQRARPARVDLSPSLAKARTDVAGMAMLAEVAAKHTTRAPMLLLGKRRLWRAACRSTITPIPTVGLPDYTPIAPPIEAAVAYSIARQESHFNQKVVSSAQRDGPDAGDAGGRQATPRSKFKATYDGKRLLERSGLQHADGRGRTVQPAARITAAPTS